jgi:hypothetical protein
MSYADDLADLLQELRVDEPSADSSGVAQRLVRACADALPVDGAAIVWMTDNGPGKTLASTDGAATILEELQFGLGEGPCIASSESGHAVLSPDLRDSGAESWPGFTAGALDAGVRAVFAFPLQAGGSRVGVLDLYRSTPGALSSANLLTAITYADAATALLLRLQSQAGPGHVPSVVSLAVAERAEVHHATGMIAVQLDIDLPTALAMLRARAFAAERPIDEVARDVVDRVIRFG